MRRRQIGLSPGLVADLVGLASASALLSGVGALWGWPWAAIVGGCLGLALYGLRTWLEVRPVSPAVHEVTER